jgi:DNA anti-recombination protein RmuC
MPIPVPQSAREAWGPEVADDVASWADDVRDQTVSRDEFQEVISRLDRVENEMQVRFGHVDERFEQVEERLGRIEDRLTQMDARFDDIHAQMNDRFDTIHARMNERFDAMNVRIDERFDAMNERFDERSDRIDEKLGQMNDRILSMTRWLIGLVVLFGTMVTVLLAVAQYTAG